MKNFVLICFLGVAFLVLGAQSACNCDYHPGGCTISRSPGAGFKCKCRYRGAWTCDALTIQCDSSERCPGNCSSRECCNRGGGDCGGY